MLSTYTILVRGLYVNKYSITFERVPSDYAILKITHNPEDQTGGDTLWASGYEVYDRLSLPIQALADTLKATHHQVRKYKHISHSLLTN